MRCLRNQSSKAVIEVGPSIGWIPFATASTCLAYLHEVCLLPGAG